MQYLRVAVVAVTAPGVAMMLDRGGAPPGSGGAAAPGATLPGATVPYWALVSCPDQVAGLSIAIVLCLAGIRLGRRLRVPNAALLGPMLVSMALTLSGITEGFAPTNMLKDLLYVLIGFEVGTRFTRRVVVEMARLIPAMTAAVVALSLVVAALALSLGWFVDLELSDLYLATTPGGINAVLATAERRSANMPLIASVQSLRLLLTVLLLPVVMRMLRWFQTRSAVASNAPDRGRGHGVGTLR
jgi:membrane AbrB-like protein